MDEVIRYVRDAEVALREASVALGKAERELGPGGSSEEMQQRLRVLSLEAHDVMLRVEDELGTLEREKLVTRPPA